MWIPCWCTTKYMTPLDRTAPSLATYQPILLFRYTAIQWDQAVALRRRRCYLESGSVEVVEVGEERLGAVRFRRLVNCSWVSVRDGVRDALAEHLERFVPNNGDALVFTDEDGDPLLWDTFHQHVWTPALRAVGLPDSSDYDIETLTTAQLWVAIQDAGAQRRQLISGWNRGGGDVA
jgi:hypothetical protein